MSNSFSYKDRSFKVGDTLSINYKIKEGDRERSQLFRGILIKIRGSTPETRIVTIRRMTRSGIGVEKIIPLSSPYIKNITVTKKSDYQKAKAYFIRGLSNQQLRSKLYQIK